MSHPLLNIQEDSSKKKTFRLLGAKRGSTDRHTFDAKDYTVPLRSCRGALE